MEMSAIRRCAAFLNQISPVNKVALIPAAVAGGGRTE